MAAVHKLTEDLYEDSFDLIALHSSLEDFALAYALNLTLRSNFKRRRRDLDISGGITIPIFEWKDDLNDRYWTFFTNKGISQEIMAKNGLFKEEPSYRNHHLLLEYREVDYFLKIEQDGSDRYRRAENEKTIAKLLTISKVVTAYTVETQKLKSKNNLIF
ncbi:IPExxxVDY family protein [Pricia sp.]|uniref:IPExxxVDY family protein n=1 Tax=Pricia sp. TaxID=2268138 RepID=UPI00359311D6